MVEYGFYKDTYLGSVIPENAFSGVAAQAASVLERFKRIYRVEIWGEDSERMAVCAMAEVLYGAQRSNGGVTAASVGNVSVRYDSAQAASRTLWRELYQKAGIYLDINRGVAAL